jgi:hypothetical protein
MSTPIPPSPAPAGPNPKGGTLVKAAWSALRADKELLTLPIVGGVASLLALLPLLIVTIVMNAGSENDTSNPSGVIVAVAFVSAFLVAIVATFFAVALAAGAHERMNGGNPTLQSAMAVAWKRKKGVIGWALLSATVGLVLQAIKDKVKGGGAIIAMLGDLAWAVASFFAIPIIAANDVGPIQALKLSTSTMKQRWSSAARVQLRLGLYGLGLAVLAVIGVVLVAFAAKASVVLAVIVGVVLGLALLAAMLILNAVTSYARVALYRYAAGMSTPGFSSGMLQAAVQQR